MLKTPSKFVLKAILNPFYGFRIASYIVRVFWQSGRAAVKAAVKARVSPLPLTAAESSVTVPLSREEKRLGGLNLSGIGLEIGPSFNPVAPKAKGYNVEILDHADAKTLREIFSRQGIKTDKIEEVDYVWSGQPISGLIGQIERYDWIIASHVIEHTPDLIGFLQECEKI